MSSTSKLSLRQPVQQLAYHKEQWEINGVQFQCHESSYEGELLNGVDLCIKQVRGLRNGPHLYDYLQDSQQLVFCASSHIMVYNTHKRTHHQLFPLKGRLQLLRAHIEKMNNRQYIMWVESYPSELEVHATRPRPRPRTRKSKNSSIVRPVKRNAFLKSLFSGEGDRFEADRQYFLLRVFDYTRKQFVFEGPLNIGRDHVLKDIFLFWNHYKIVGYVTEEYETNIRFVYYQNVQSKNKGQGDLFGLTTELFSKLQTSKQLNSLIFNSELNNYIFAHNSTLNQLVIKEEVEDGDQELFRQFLSLVDRKVGEGKLKALRLEVEQTLVLSGQILSLALNDQYLAVLTATGVTFHSAYDISSIIFTHQFDIGQSLPISVEFSKTNVLITYRGQAKISTFMVRNKTLKLVSETKLEVSHCRQILKIYTNSISSQVFCLSVFDQLPGRQYLGASLSGALLQGLVEYVARPACVDVVATFLTPARPEAITLGLAQRRFKRLHTCPWLSTYFVETEEGMEYGKLQQSFQNKRCLALHPTGLFLIVCLRDGFKVYIVTSEGFTNTYRGDSLKDVQAVAISSAGNHLAVASATAIFLYDFYSCTKLKTITLPFGPSIDSLEYSGNVLVCQLRNRKVYLYDSLNEYKQILVFNPRSSLGEGSKQEQAECSSLGPLHYDHILNFLIYSYGSTIYFYNCTTQAVQTTTDIEPLSRIYYCQSLSTLFFGTQGGELFCFAWPNKPTNLQGQQRKFRLHASRIVDIRVSSDLRQLITIGEDESLCVSSLVLVQNLKRYEGLELVEHLAPSIRIGYDFLGRRGLHQYTHSKFNEKTDLLKDYEDEVLNMHFILPEERQKQKEQMFANVRLGIQDIAEDSSHLYTEIADSTNEARDIVAYTRKELLQFIKQSQIEREEIKQKLYADYINRYNATQKSIEELHTLKVKCQDEVAAVKREYQHQLERYTIEWKQRHDELVKEQQIQMRSWKQVEWAQLGEIDEEKKMFIEENVKALDGVLADLNSNNGILACKNNNIEKEITQIKRKLQEQRYLVARLEGSTAHLRDEQHRYNELKRQNKREVEREDRVNLTQIEKLYVKQTQALIEKDKEINVQLVNHEKEKSILIHLQKCLEEVQGNIEQLVAGILQEKRDRKEETIKIEQIRTSSRALRAEAIARKKQKVNSRNMFKNYVCQVEGIIEDVIHASSRQNIQKLLIEKGLIQPSVTSEGLGSNRENQMLNKIISEKVYNLNGESRAGIKLLKGSLKAYRSLKTEGGEANSTSRGHIGKDFSVTSRQLVQRKAKEVYSKLDSEQKHYERIKTQQLVFQNTRKKFNLENQDLIENYNSLAMENKKSLISLRRQESLSRLPIRKQKNFGKGEGSPTPFELYLQNKASANRTTRIPIPAKSFQY